MNKFIKVPISVLILALPSWVIASESDFSFSKEESSEISPGVESSKWAVDKLKKLRVYYPLEKNHTSFPKNELPVVLDRISRGFRELSCKVEYGDKSLSARCTTMEMLKFHVSLFESRKDPNVILLEIQRRSGDTLIYKRYADYILNLVKEDASIFNYHSKNYDLGMIFDRLELDLDVKDSEVEDAFKIATYLVLNDRFDATCLGLESFVIMTNPSKVAINTSFKIVRTLLNPTDEKSSELVQLLLSDALGEKDEEFRYLALQVWVNAWELAAKDLEKPLSTFADTLASFGGKSYLMSDLLTNLMHNVRGAAKDPHLATLSLNGISALGREIPELRHRIEWEAVEEAYNVGMRENIALLAAASNCMELIIP